MNSSVALPSVSVVIPTYNRAGMVVDAVESVLAQTFGGVELIVVDDGGADDTPDRLAKFGDQVIYVRQKNQGVSAARNTGIRRATGEWIAFLDSDECWHRQKLEVQAAYVRRHPEVDLLACRLGKLRTGEECTAPLPDIAGVPCEPVELSRLVISACFQTSTVLVKRSCVEAVGMFDSNLRSAEDRDLWIRLGARYCVQHLDLPMAFSQTADRDHLSGKPEATEYSSKKMIDKVFSELPQLKGRRSWRRRALSVAAHEAGILYTEKGDHAKAIHRIMRSLVLWPLPRRGYVDARFKSLAVMSLRLAKLRKD